MTQKQLKELEGTRIRFFMQDRDNVSHKFEGRVHLQEVLVKGQKTNTLKLIDLLRDNVYHRPIVISYSLLIKLKDWMVIR